MTKTTWCAAKSCDVAGVKQEEQHGNQEQNEEDNSGICSVRRDDEMVRMTKRVKKKRSDGEEESDASEPFAQRRRSVSVP
mmetsp:Transcript_19943/g.41205  ORF Transcript_19943/g.41205 Transcript_19943/m.41205 type:complete len:80 (-) Transcript_19943:22-261(-)